MLPLLALAAGSAGLGLLKSELIDKPNEEKDREIQSITDRYSPWTGMRGKMVDHTNPLGEAAAMGAQGLQLGSSVNSAESQDALNSAIASKLGAKGGADAMSAAAVNAAQGAASSPASGASRLAAPVGSTSGDDSGLDSISGPVGNKDALLLAALSSAYGNRKSSGIL